jgi:hypothetical protein
MSSNIQSQKDAMALPIDKIVEVIRELRNAIIKGFLLDENLVPYFKSRFTKELTDVKKQFLKKDLTELLISPVDLAHYSSLIKEIKESNSTSPALHNEGLFYEELNPIFAKYTF